MIELKIDGNTYEMVQEWEEINVSQFQELYKTLDLPATLARNINLFKILTKYKINDEIIDGIDFDEFNKIIGKFNFLFEKVDIEIDKEKPIIINDIEYYLIDLDKISLGEWADLENLITQNDETIIDNLPELMSILIRKKDEKYDNKIINNRIEEFKENASGLIGLKFIDFFLISELKFTNNLTNSLMAKMNKTEREALLRQTGVGLDISTDLQENQS